MHKNPQCRNDGLIGWVIFALISEERPAMRRFSADSSTLFSIDPE